MFDIALKVALDSQGLESIKWGAIFLQLLILDQNFHQSLKIGDDLKPKVAEIASKGQICNHCEVKIWGQSN